MLSSCVSNQSRVNDANEIVEDLTLELSVVESTWKDAFNRFDIDFGYTTEDHFYRRHTDFEKVRRQAISIPTGTPEDVTSQTFDVSSSLIDTPFAIPDFISTIIDLVPVPELPEIPIDLRCKNCSTTGSVVLTQGAISIDAGNLFDLDLSTDVISGGFFELAANDLSAHIELVAKPKINSEFEIKLPSFPILGFVIPGIGEAGVTFNQSIKARFEVPSSIEINYGFDVVVCI